mgnify:CR=1 FL=1
MTPFKRQLFNLLVLMSGFSALTYEVVWSRHLALLFGTSMLAVATVTATFMAGLALGSLLFGKYADHHPAPLRLYALLELGIGGSALLFPVLLELITSLYLALPENSVIAPLVRPLLAALALLPAATCMGGTLPVVSRFLHEQRFSRLVGRLYALNTLGAVAGALACGFLLIPNLGMNLTQGLAIAINLGIALTAWTLHKGAAQSSAVPLPPPPNHVPQPQHRRWALSAAALVGLVALAYEMLWTRLFLLFLGNTTYAFATILGVYLLGLALGSALYARFLTQRSTPPRMFFTLLSLQTLFVLSSLFSYDRFALLFESIHLQADGRWWLLASLSFLVVALAILPPALFSGALLPATLRLLYRNPENAAESVGQVLCWNTAGAVAGSFIGVYAVSVWGLAGAFKGVSAIALLLMVLFGIRFHTQLSPRLVASMVGITLLVLIVPVRWNQGLLNSGIYVYAHYYHNQGGLNAPQALQQPTDVVEGLETTAAFYRSAEGYKEFRVNGKSDGGTRPGDMATQVLLGQLPMLLHSEPQENLVIGLGTGITLNQVLDTPEAYVDAVEISPEVIRISRHFSVENQQVLDSPRVNLHIKDGRNLLLTATRTFDVIISEPSNPWQAGNANLFTREFYALAGSRLQADGIFCQWLPLYDLSASQLKIALRTLSESFPHLRSFVLGGDMILLGSFDPLQVNSQQLAERFERAETRNHLAQAGISSPAELLGRFYFGNTALIRDVAGNAPVNTDNHPHLEFSRQTGLSHARDNLRMLVEARTRLGNAALN